VRSAVFKWNEDVLVHGRDLLSGHRNFQKTIKGFPHGLRHKSIEEQFHIERDDDDGCHPAKDVHYQSVRKFAHLGLLTGESQERPDRKAELHAEDDLARHQQLGGFSFAENPDDEYGRNNGDQTRQQSSNPRRDAKVKKTFHYNLSGQRSSKRRILSGSEKCHGEEDAGDTDSEKRAKQIIGVLNLSDMLMTGPVKGGGSQNQDRAVNEEGEHKGHS